MSYVRGHGRGIGWVVAHYRRPHRPRREQLTFALLAALPVRVVPAQRTGRDARAVPADGALALVAGDRKAEWRNLDGQVARAAAAADPFGPRLRAMPVSSLWEMPPGEPPR